jgi:hypothetical protein
MLAHRSDPSSHNPTLANSDHLALRTPCNSHSTPHLDNPGCAHPLAAIACLATCSFGGRLGHYPLGLAPAAAVLSIGHHRVHRRCRSNKAHTDNTTTPTSSVCKPPPTLTVSTTHLVCHACTPMHQRHSYQPFCPPPSRAMHLFKGCWSQWSTSSPPVSTSGKPSPPHASLLFAAPLVTAALTIHPSFCVGPSNSPR